MTQREKLMRATMMAQRLKGIAKAIEYDAKDYDVRWPLQYSESLNNIADEFLKLK